MRLRAPPASDYPPARQNPTPRARRACAGRLARSGGTPRRRCGNAPCHARHGSRTLRHRSCTLWYTLAAASAQPSRRMRSAASGRASSPRRCRRSPDRAGCSGQVSGPPPQQGRRRRRRYKLARSHYRRQCRRSAPRGSHSAVSRHANLEFWARSEVEALLADRFSAWSYPAPFHLWQLSSAPVVLAHQSRD